VADSESSEFPQNRDRVRAEERHSLALELHDTVGQVLVLTKLQLARMQQQLREPLDVDTHARLHISLSVTKTVTASCTVP
jgi:signal transduction histidine kinase